MIEFHWPNTPKVEFNARRARPGWTPWGFDVPATSAEPMPSGSALGASDGSLPPRTTPSREIAAAHPLDIPEFLRRTPRRAEPPVSEPVIKARLGQ
jgi:hypothetical protein